MTYVAMYVMETHESSWEESVVLPCCQTAEGCFVPKGREFGEY